LNDDLRNIPVTQIVEPCVILRPVRKDSIDYLEMRDSIERHGLFNSISVRLSRRRPGFWEVIDGNWRFHCARDLDLETVPCIVKDMTDDDVLASQIQANAIRPDTKPCEYARQLKRIQKARPGITIAELAVMVKKRPSWIKQQLGLLDLGQEIQQLVDRGEIPVQNGYMLGKIPLSLRAQYVDQAKIKSVAEFQALGAAVIKQYTEAVKQGKLDAFFTDDFTPQPHVRGLKVLLDELHSNADGPLILASEGCRTPLDGWNLALKWAMHLDKRSVEEQERAARGRTRRSRGHLNRGVDDA
jgi:ParB/RepB/Spo0J family partition protein